MEFRRLGASGLSVSVVGLGTNNFGARLDAAGSRAVVDAALEAGVTLFDTADVYGASEEHLGMALEGRRDDVVIATKFGAGLARVGARNGLDWDARGSRRYVRRAVESSFRRLRTDWIDLYQLHAPDPLTPIEETLSVLSDLVHEGKIRYIGHSNFSGFLTADADWTARTGDHVPFVSAQNEYSLLETGIEADLVPALVKYGIGLLPYHPLANGLLTGKYRRGEQPPDGTRLALRHRPGAMSDANFDRLDALQKFASERGLSLLEVAIGGLAARPAVASVIAGATSAEQMTANAQAGQWRPAAADIEELNTITG